MPTLETLIVFTLAATVMNISPGPSNLYVLSRTVSNGWPGGVTAALGLATGSLVHVAAPALGLVALFQYSPSAHVPLKLIGAAYLIYLGIRYYVQSDATVEMPSAANRTPALKIFRESVLVEVLNPKTALFFLAFLPQFVDVHRGNAESQILVLGFIVTLTALPCDLFVAWSAQRVVQLMTRHPWFASAQNRVAGTLLIGLGLFVATTERAP